MFKIRWYVLLGFCTYIAFLLVNFPAHYMFKLFPDAQRVGPATISSVSGTLWNGGASVAARIERVPLSLDVRWTFQPIQLLTGKLGVFLDVNASGLQLEGGAAISPTTVYLDQVEGEVHSSFVNQFVQSQGVELPGKFKVDDMSVAFKHKDKLAKSASGTLSWPGGSVVYRGGGSQNFDVPALLGSLSVNEQNSLAFRVSDSGKALTYAGAELDPTGWAKVFVNKRVMALAGQNVSNRNADKPLFQVKHKIL